MQHPALESVRPARRGFRWAVSIAALCAIALGVGAAVLKRDLPLELLKARYAPAPSRFIDVGGMSVHYRDEGAGPADRGTGSLNTRRVEPSAQDWASFWSGVFYSIFTRV